MQSRLQSSLNSDYAKSTSSFLSSLLTTTTSKYNTLRRQLISSETDGDTEDDSHIARALRAYYTEKGRAFPDWLPKDPKAPVPQQPAQMVSSAQPAMMSAPGQQAGGGAGAAAGGGGGPAAPARWRQGGGLSDLWGDNGRQPQPAAEAPTNSLRARPAITSSASAFSTPGRFGARLAPQEESQARPLPSQRAGSYQAFSSSSSSSGRFESAAPAPAAAAVAGGTAQDRLKAKLWGASRSASPDVGGAWAPPPPAAQPGGGGGAGGNPYAPSAGGGARSGRYPSAGSSSQGRAMVSANSPWSSGEYEGGAAGAGAGAAGAGLPSGPRAGRQGLGLPSGPRPQRF